MYKIFKSIGLLVFSCIVSFAAFAMDDFPGDVPTDDVETWELATTYRELCEIYNDDTSSIRDLDNALTGFKEGIFLPTEQNNNPIAFLERARGIRGQIINEIGNPRFDHLSKHLENLILPQLKNRIDLARLDENVIQGFGSRGGNDFTNIALNNSFQDINLKAALDVLTGRIFQIELIDGVVDINNSSILSTSSGTLIDSNPFTQQINNLLPLSNTQLYSVLTCAHSLSVEEGRAKTYFVRTGLIDLATGFPVGIDDLNGNDTLIDFLENHPDVYPLSSLHIKNRTLNQWRQCNLDMGQPQFFENEDLVIGNINIGWRDPPIYDANWTISFQQNNVNLMNNGERYFSVGYPGCRHYVNNSPLNLVQDEELSTFFITSSLNTTAHPVEINVNGSINHRSPCAAGMSGGPLFHFIGANQINIFGVITSGEDVNEGGCHWY